MQSNRDSLRRLPLAAWRAPIQRTEKTITDEDAIEVAVQYSERFNLPAPHPFGVEDSFYVSVLRQALRDGKPVDPDFDWYPDLPPGAVA